MRNTDRDWERFGATDPYFAVLTDPKFRRGRIDDEARDEFFASGDHQIEDLFQVIRGSVDSSFAPRRALEFGCGVGRLLIPLSRRVDSVVGIDVSASMLEEARKNCAARSVSNVELALSDDALSQVHGEFDLVYSLIVFQHIPPRRGEVILERLLSHLRAGAVAVLHFTYASPFSPLKRVEQWARSRIPYGHEVANLLSGSDPKAPLMQMNDYDLRRLFAILERAGCDRAYVELTNHGGFLGAIFFVRKRAPRT